MAIQPAAAAQSAAVQPVAAQTATAIQPAATQATAARPAVARPAALCAICGENPLQLPPGQAAMDCAWCAEFVQLVNAAAHVKAIHHLHEYTPLHHFSGGPAAAAAGRHLHVDSFVGAVTQKTVSRGIALLGRVQSSPEAEALGLYFHGHPRGYRGAFRHDYAVPRAWNAGEAHVTLAIPPGIRWLEGTAAPQPGFPGGGTQMFIPIEVVRALFEPSYRFLRSPSAAAYARFLTECKPAFAAQKRWKAAYKQEKAFVDRDAADRNELKAIRARFESKDFFDLLESHAAAVGFAARCPGNAAEGAALLQQIEEVVQSRNVARFKWLAVQAAEVLARQPGRADLAAAGLPPWLQRLLRKEAATHTQGEALTRTHYVVRDFGCGVSLSVELRFVKETHPAPNHTIYHYELVYHVAGH